MDKALRRIPLDEMSNAQLKDYVFNQTLHFPQKLTVNEQAALCTAMWNSVVLMKLKCMSQEERNAFYETKKRKEAVKQKVKTQIKERHNRLKTHHVYV